MNNGSLSRIKLFFIVPQPVLPDHLQIVELVLQVCHLRHLLASFSVPFIARMEAILILNVIPFNSCMRE